ncbi:hypothetical protein ACRAWF_21455 [Streptomyces sp. L7]
MTVVVDAKSADGYRRPPCRPISKRIAATEGVVSVSAARFNPAGDTAVFSAVPSTGPSDERTKDLVHTIRGERLGDRVRDRHGRSWSPARPPSTSTWRRRCRTR